MRMQSENLSQNYGFKNKASSENEKKILCNQFNRIYRGK
jgi:hypothetical protein